jgi:hypothetical protein
MYGGFVSGNPTAGVNTFVNGFALQVGSGMNTAGNAAWPTWTLEIPPANLILGATNTLTLSLTFGATAAYLNGLVIEWPVA